MNRHTDRAARLAVTAVLRAVEMVVKGDWKAAYAVVRPPGHHSGAALHPTGFCIFNNLAIAAKHCL